MLFLVSSLRVLLWRCIIFFIIVITIIVGRFEGSITLLKVLVNRWAQGFVLDESIQSIDFTIIVMVVMVSRGLVMLTQHELPRDHWWRRMNLLLSIFILWNSHNLGFLINMARCISLYSHLCHLRALSIAYIVCIINISLMGLATRGILVTRRVNYFCVVFHSICLSRWGLRDLILLRKLLLIVIMLNLSLLSSLPLHKAILSIWCSILLH